MGKRDAAPAGGIGAINLGGTRAALLRVHHGGTIGVELHIIQTGGSGYDVAHRAASDRDHLQTATAAILRREKEPGRIGRPGHAVHPAIMEPFG